MTEKGRHLDKQILRCPDNGKKTAAKHHLNHKGGKPGGLSSDMPGVRFLVFELTFVVPGLEDFLGELAKLYVISVLNIIIKNPLKFFNENNEIGSCNFMCAIDLSLFSHHTS
jgi:hypothetical protein